MDFFAFLFLILFILVFFIYWSNILTKDSTFGVDNLNLLIFLTMGAAILYLFWGLLVIQTPNAWLNGIIVVVLGLHTFIANKRYSRYWGIFIFEFALTWLYLVGYLWIFRAYSQFESVDFILACVNLALANLDYLALFRKEWKQQHAESAYQKQNGQIKNEMPGLFNRYRLAHEGRDREFNEEQRARLQIILQGSPMEWLGLPEPIQDLYFQSLVKKVKK
jgi:hypothetical protein